MSNTHEIENSKIFEAVAQLTEIIELSATRDDDNADGSTVIEILQSLIVNHEDIPEGRGTAGAARDALLALRNAAASLIGVIERDLDALTFDLTRAGAQRVLYEYADISQL